MPDRIGPFPTPIGSACLLPILLVSMILLLVRVFPTGFFSLTTFLRDATIRRYFDIDAE
jgi:hypothetical protein